eukprot:CAMPEP_0115001112 /NCGR_PEP_ID=MMETSP0216-20121206/17169_1 /TAXON_ID=223996 /ORGANISM="Protocruzia adherens, Strain Boccale" /LENGTH=903 /DNA_ID=CAMNT_0002366359 /DNA_START=371 /DNA_END=3082 /DNA_ORIENTATION=+
MAEQLQFEHQGNGATAYFPYSLEENKHAEVDYQQNLDFGEAEEENYEDGYAREYFKKQYTQYFRGSNGENDEDEAAQIRREIEAEFKINNQLEFVLHEPPNFIEEEPEPLVFTSKKEEEEAAKRAAVKSKKPVAVKRVKKYDPTTGLFVYKTIPVAAPKKKTSIFGPLKPKRKYPSYNAAKNQRSSSLGKSSSKKSITEEIEKGGKSKPEWDANTHLNSKGNTKQKIPTVRSRSVTSREEKPTIKAKTPKGKKGKIEIFTDIDTLVEKENKSPTNRDQRGRSQKKESRNHIAENIANTYGDPRQGSQSRGRQRVALNDNLEFKMSDTKNLVKSLEEQLDQERKMRRQMDLKFVEKMNELQRLKAEKVKKLDSRNSQGSPRNFDQHSAIQLKKEQERAAKKAANSTECKKSRKLQSDLRRMARTIKKQMVSSPKSPQSRTVSRSQSMSRSRSISQGRQRSGILRDHSASEGRADSTVKSNRKRVVISRNPHLVQKEMQNSKQRTMKRHWSLSPKTKIHQAKLKKIDSKVTLKDVKRVFDPENDEEEQNPKDEVLGRKAYSVEREEMDGKIDDQKLLKKRAVFKETIRSRSTSPTGSIKRKRSKSRESREPSAEVTRIYPQREYTREKIGLNQELRRLEDNLDTIQDKIAPVQDKLKKALDKLQRARNYRNQDLIVDLVAKVSAQSIAYHSDDLVDLLVDDLLQDTVKELQHIEAHQNLKEEKIGKLQIAGDLLDEIDGFQNFTKQVGEKLNLDAYDPWKASENAFANYSVNNFTNSIVNRVDRTQNPFGRSTFDQLPTYEENNKFSRILAVEARPEQSVEIYRPVTHWHVELDERTEQSISDYRKKRERHVRLHNICSDGDVWSALDKIAAQLLTEVWAEAMVEYDEDLEGFVKGVVLEEFHQF